MDVKVAYFKAALPSPDGRAIALGYAAIDKDEDGIIYMPTRILEPFIPVLAKSCLEAKDKAGESNARSMLKMRRGSVGLSEDGQHVIFDFEMDAGGARFSFQIPTSDAHLFQKSLAETLDGAPPAEPEGPAH